jgi:predicted enzyme related to lactoylglutathione lyase
MSNPIVHFEIMGSDPGKSQQFYSALFGWSLGAPAPELGGYAMVDGQTAGLSGGIGSEGPGGRLRTTFYVGVDDLQAALDRAVELGGTMTSPPMEIPGTSISLAQFTDPDGNLIGLVKGMS